MKSGEVSADDDAAEGQEGFMDVVSSFESHAESAELMKPTHGSFHHPAIDAQPAAVRDAPAATRSV